jgi:hypothetical protein
MTRWGNLFGEKRGGFGWSCDWLLAMIWSLLEGCLVIGGFGRRLLMVEELEVLIFIESLGSD